MARGRLRIYLGAAPGVGKTVAMLAEGRRAAERGKDVVVAICETHGRQHTAQMLEGLETVPRVRLAHRGAVLSEMDLAAVLGRRPAIALVDELAHTNAPGSRNDKRWRDVEELLAAGIDVISTVNIQHLESLNDAVTTITGIAQHETVPDEVVRAADQIEFVDMSPEALRRRMAHGNVYTADKIDAALANYFRPGNLSALRELALLWVADRVDEGLGRYRDEHGITSPWPTRERVLVALSGGPEGATLLRRGARIAGRGAGGELHAVHVARADGLTSGVLPRIAEQRALTGDLGGTFHAVTGEDTAEAVLDFARGINASQIVVGTSRHHRWVRVLRQATGDAIIARSGEIDVHVVTHPHAASLGVRRPRRTLSRGRTLSGYLLSVGASAAVTAALSPWARAVGLPLIVQLYLLLTVLVALVGGLGPAVVTAVGSCLLINWFFTPPVHTLTIASAQNALALGVFVVVGVLVSNVVLRAAARAEEALRAQHESAALAELTHTLLGSTDQLALLLSRAVDLFAASSVAVVRRPTHDDPAPEIVAATAGFPPGLAISGGAAREPVDERHVLVLDGDPLAADQQRLFAACAVHAGAILHRRVLRAEAAAAERLERDNRARTALLSAVSHDLRTPLAAIKAAIGSLRTTEVDFPPEDEAELEAIIEESADRLAALVDNLLDMSRLSTEALVASPQDVDLAELLPACVATVSEPSRVRWALGAGARRVQADPGLLDRVLGNIVENALRHQPRGGEVLLTTSAMRDQVEIRVVDHGPGIAPGDQDRVFRPFQRLGDAPAGDGVGLGLAVARGLAEAMDGSVVAEDTPGGGLTMVVSLPIAMVAGPVRLATVQEDHP
ncbi:sensor histidine kinase [Arsenicicoccus dermatophilus]|uniref:sensor histidine kinase n=1 Tax=Arsenicicoccus dermatophilus TaxID=1076331 RepID=UPI001F4C9189|nr:ATP-binding protein [Arsenicicoccus dermatophilus]MCH8611537.1 DUF4118 domain-containing protein [Arsenicicoccus dermatophilus]